MFLLKKYKDTKPPLSKTLTENDIFIIASGFNQLTLNAKIIPGMKIKYCLNHGTKTHSQT